MPRKKIPSNTTGDLGEMSIKIFRSDAPFVSNKTGNMRINVALKRVRETIFAVEKQYVLQILCVCSL
jgi:hypothetical protein